ncbi:hypothetical protein F5Y19DRAFT_477012 [Xylariaceae sp. FL1651]|nr:hypothetical protein F5Y19DRAFT_477012 [Xylariaceae sp. FL1651]
MSHLTEYSLLLDYVKSRFEGRELAKQVEHSQFGGVTVSFPLAELPSLTEVNDFYSRLNVEVERSQLKPHRKSAYRKFIREAYFAHYTVGEYQPRWGTIWHLQDTVFHLVKALRIMEEGKEYDDAYPVHWSEVYQVEVSENRISPPEYWLLFKLESLLPVLRLSVRVLRLIFPDCYETWNEWEDSLCRKEWLQDFILDSKKSSRRVIPLYAPRRVDILGEGATSTPYTKKAQ